MGDITENIFSAKANFAVRLSWSYTLRISHVWYKPDGDSVILELEKTFEGSMKL